MDHTTVNVPRWVMWLFTGLQPVIASAILGGVGLLFMLNNRVTVLTVQMESALETKGELKAIDARFNLMSERMSRMEGRLDEPRGNP